MPATYKTIKNIKWVTKNEKKLQAIEKINTIFFYGNGVNLSLNKSDGPNTLRPLHNTKI